MVFMTKPCQSTGEQPNGAPWPQDSPARQEAYNALLRQVAAQHPDQVYVQDLNSYVCPGGNYTEDLDGVPVRESDGSHFDMQPGGGGDYLAPAILPYWVELGPPAGGADERCERPERIAPPVLRSAVRPVSGERPASGRGEGRHRPGAARTMITSVSPAPAPIPQRRPDQPVCARARSK